MDIKEVEKEIDKLPRFVTGYMKECNWQKDFHNNFRECVRKFGGELVETYLKLRNISSPKNPQEAKVFTRIGQAEIFLQKQPIFYDRSGMFWVWKHDEKKWEKSDEVDILNMVEEELGENTISSKSRTEIINSLKQVGRKNVPKDIKPSWIQFKDKVYDIKTGDSFEATPEYFITNPIPWEVSHKTDTPTIDKIFKEWVGEDYVDTLYEIIAYSMLPDYPIHRLFCFIGEGMNGKSCFLRLMRKFIGKDNTCATELDTLLTSRFEVTRLHKKLICMMGETNFSEVNKTSILKKLTGQDVVGFEYKNKTPFEDTNYAKILIATNNLPSTSDKTIGFYRRWTIIDFPNRFTEKKDVLKEIPENEYNNLATKCILVLKNLLEKRKFHNEGSIEERMKKYEEKSNPLDKFWTDNVKESPDEDISKKQFYEKLNAWCKENRFRTVSEITISKYMKERGVDTFRKTMDWIDTPPGQSKPRFWSWSGISWKNI